MNRRSIGRVSPGAKQTRDEAQVGSDVVIRRPTALGVATALVALCVAATAQADAQPVPAGFTANAALSRAASFVAGKTVVSYCATTRAAFTASLHNLPDWTDPSTVEGYSTIGAASSFLNTDVCSDLTRWHAKKRVPRFQLASSLLVLVHEAELLAGVTDESIADCKGLAKMPQVIARFFPLRKIYTLHDVMGDAWSAHDNEPEPYLENCPQR